MSSKLRLLVVDDDPLIAETISLNIPEHWQMQHIDNPKKLTGDFFHAAFVDVHLSGDLNKNEGFQVMRTLSGKHSLSEIVAMSGDIKRDIMESALQAGASRFLAKPLAVDEVKRVLEKIETLWGLRGVQLGETSSSVKWIGESKLSDEVRRFIASVNNESAPILIEGESGTGKEVVAQLIHQSHPERPFVAINVAALSENLFESELFGHVKGAFTGAIHNKAGLVEQAHGGDLFLDEIEALSQSHQAKLLRFLESGEFQKVGSTELQKVDVRIIAATNEKLTDLVKKDRFREDLMYRLAGHKLIIPPLRERTEDIKELCQFFLSARSISMKKTLAEDAITELERYPWPGNVRQLKRTCEHLALAAPLPIIRGEDVQQVLSPVGLSGGGSVLNSNFDLDQGLSALVNDYEKKVLKFALEQNLEIDDLAKKLQISRSSLYKKIKDHQLEIKK